MQSHTLIESQPKVNDPLSSSVIGASPRMGPVPGEFLRPLPVLSSSNSNTTLKYHKKAAILNHTQNLKHELDARYNGLRYESVRSNGENTNAYNGSSVSPPSGDSENENNLYINEKLESNNYPKHFASMQGPYGIINNSMFLKEEDTRQGRSRFLSSDLLNNNASDKVNSSQVKYSGQFQANYIGHLTSQNYLNRPAHPHSGESTYLNGNANCPSDRPDDSRNPSSRSNSARSPTNLHRSSPLKLESNQENALEDEPGNTNKKFKVPSSKVPKESLLKYRILHKNNQRNLTSQVESTSTLQRPDMNVSVASPTSSGTLIIPGNETLCDSNLSIPSNLPDASHRFKRPAEADVSRGGASPGVINSEIQPNHFTKGVLIKLENGLIKQLEDLKTEDFVTSAEKSTRHRLEPSTVMRIEEKPGATHIVLTLCYGEKRHQVEYESVIEQPYYVIDKGWSSHSPTRTHSKYGLVCQQLNVGDTCISLCPQSEAPSPSKAQARLNKRKELEKHFDQLTSRDKELNERKKRRWSAPDQIHEKGAKKSGAKQSKPNEEEGERPATLPTSGESVVKTTAYQHDIPKVLFNQYPANSGQPSYPAQSSLPSHLQYVSPVSNASSSSNTYLTPAMTPPIVSHLPLASSASNFSISTLSTPASSHSQVYPSSKPSYLVHTPPSLPPMPSPPTSIPFTYVPTPNFINGNPISTIYSRNGYPVKYTTSAKNNFGNVGTLAKSSQNYSASANVAVDFSKYAMKK